MLTRLLTGLSHLREHKFKHSFQDSLKPICRCGTDVESCVHYFLHCLLFQKERLILLNIVKNIDSELCDYSNLTLIQILFFGDTSLDVNTNSYILSATIDFVISSKRFEEPLFYTHNFFFTPVTNFYQNLFCILFPWYWYYLEHYICFI